MGKGSSYIILILCQIKISIVLRYIRLKYKKVFFNHFDDVYEEHHSSSYNKFVRVFPQFYTLKENTFKATEFLVYFVILLGPASISDFMKNNTLTEKEDWHLYLQNIPQMSYFPYHSLSIYQGLLA